MMPSAVSGPPVGRFSPRFYLTRRFVTSASATLRSTTEQRDHHGIDGEVCDHCRRTTNATTPADRRNGTFAHRDPAVATHFPRRRVARRVLAASIDHRALLAPASGQSRRG